MLFLDCGVGGVGDVGVGVSCGACLGYCSGVVDLVASSGCY